MPNAISSGAIQGESKASTAAKRTTNAAVTTRTSAVAAGAGVRCGWCRTESRARPIVNQSDATGSGAGTGRMD
jgi:hypothetical protein